MMLTQRQINHGVFGVLTIGGLLLLISVWATALGPTTEITVLIGTVVSGGLWAAYRWGWEYARHSAVIFLTLLAGLGIPDVTQQFDPLIFIVPLMALLLTGPRWMVASAVTILAIVLVRANGQGVYVDPSNLLIYMAIIIGLVFSGLATGTAQRLAEVGARAERALAQTERQARQLEQQARELAQRNTEQQGLLDLVATLETPAVQIADGALLVPITGHLDSRRAEALTTRLLENAHAQRAWLIILDIAGVSVVDTLVAQALVQTAQALRLLGCTVFLSGITADVATTLVHLGIGLEGITPVRTPQEALARAAKLARPIVHGSHERVRVDRQGVVGAG
jgi:rsbT co-antagonist protein RsbR